MLINTKLEQIINTLTEMKSKKISKIIAQEHYKINK